MQETSLTKTLFRSLRHRNFRLFWSGQLVSLIGTWMQNVGQAWLVLELTHSSLKLGIVSALQFLPMLFLSLFTGPFIDYFDKRRIIIWTQAALMVLAFVLSLLVWTGTVQYWHIVILATLLGVVNTIDMPARQAFIMDMVGKEDLMNAVALNSSIFNAARAIGPALAGMLIAAMGTAVCFFMNGVSFLAVLAGLLFMRVERATDRRKPDYNVLKDMGEAIRYIRATPVVLMTILLVSVVSVFGTNFNVLVPVFAKMELHRDAAAFGFLMSSFGAGALIGAFSLAVLSRYGPKTSLLLGGGMCLSLVSRPDRSSEIIRPYRAPARLVRLVHGDLLRHGKYHGPAEYRGPLARSRDEHLHPGLRGTDPVRELVCRLGRSLDQSAPHLCHWRIDMRGRFSDRDNEAQEHRRAGK